MPALSINEAVTQIRDILSDSTLTETYIQSLLDESINIERAITKHFHYQTNQNIHSNSVVNKPNKVSSTKQSDNKLSSASKTKNKKNNKIDNSQTNLNTFFSIPKLCAHQSSTDSDNVVSLCVKAERANDISLQPVKHVDIIDNENSRLSREISNIVASQYIHNDDDSPPPLEHSVTPTNKAINEHVNHDDTIHSTDGNVTMNNNAADNILSPSTASHIINNNTVPVKEDVYYAKSPYEACWHAGTPVPYQHLSRTFAVLEHTTNRKQMLNMLIVMYWHILELTPQSLYPAVMLTSNSLAPAYENVTLGVGGTMLSSVVRSLTGISRSAMHDDWTKYGDLGIIAHKYSLSQSLITKPKPLTVDTVYNSLLQIAAIEGKDSQNKKSAIIRKLCIATTEHEITYIIRTLETELRIGAVITTVLNAVAKSCVLHCHYRSMTPHNQRICTYQRVLQYENIIQFNSPIDKLAKSDQAIAMQIINAIKQIRAVYNEFPNIRDIIKCIVQDTNTIHNLTDHLHLTVGVPIKPMLARITKNWNQIFELYDREDFTAEIKYDGQRCQIHYIDQYNIKIYSRHMLDTTRQWPESLILLHNVIANKSMTHNYIIDAEIVAVEFINEGSTQYRILPFQELTKRSRGSKKDDPPNGSVYKSNKNTTTSLADDEFTLMTDIVKHNKQVKIMIIVFDLLYLNNESLMRLPLLRRRSTAHSIFTTISGQFEFSEHIDVLYSEWQSDQPNIKSTKVKQGRITNVNDDSHADVVDEVNDNDSSTISPSKKARLDDTQLVLTHKPSNDTDNNTDRYNTDQESMSELQRIIVSKLQSFLVEHGSIRGEGLMLKSLSAVYEPDVRGDKWVKLKKDYIGGIGIADSFDCVVIGGWDGNGRKAGMISPWLVAVYNSENNTWETLCKVMSGFSDTEYDILTKRYKTQYLLTNKPDNYIIHDSLLPQYYFDTREVWEIRGADLTISPKHTAAIDLIIQDKGISLRFPRFIRIRNKQITDATTNTQVAQYFQSQSITVPINRKVR